MQRIVILGSGGAGKSTLARRLHEKLHLPLVHLDAHYWLPNWVEVDPRTWPGTVRRLATEPRWIMDGNFGSTMDIRLERADTVIFLDQPRWRCIYRVLRRATTGKRVDCIPGCRESFDWVFLKWIWNYPRKRKPGILATLRALPPQKKVVHLRNKREIEAFLKTLE